VDDDRPECYIAHAVTTAEEPAALGEARSGGMGGVDFVDLGEPANLLSLGGGSLYLGASPRLTDDDGDSRFNPHPPPPPPLHPPPPHPF